MEYAFSGEEQVFFDKQEYIQAYRNALDQFGVSGGFKATTFTIDPQTRKAIDDLIYGAFGEDNPNDLEHYQRKYGPIEAEDQTQEAKTSEPECEELEQ